MHPYQVVLKRFCGYFLMYLNVCISSFNHYINFSRLLKSIQWRYWQYRHKNWRKMESRMGTWTMNKSHQGQEVSFKSVWCPWAAKACGYLRGESVWMCIFWKALSLMSVGIFGVSRSPRQWSTVIPSKLRKALFECQLTMKIGRSGLSLRKQSRPKVNRSTQHVLRNRAFGLHSSSFLNSPSSATITFQLLLGNMMNFPVASNTVGHKQTGPMMSYPEHVHKNGAEKQDTQHSHLELH